ncbi:MAG: hypothetical protein IJY56_00080 [Clostridia bacterium]|nr:hypothetical protein [Clostridia bacterium]
MKKLLIALLIAATALFCACSENEEIKIITQTDDPEVMDVYNDDGTPRVIAKYDEIIKGEYRLQYYTVYEYNEDGLEIRAVEYSPRGNTNYVFEKTYDEESGLLLTETTLDADGRLVTRLTYVYDQNGELTDIKTEGEGA